MKKILLLILTLAMIAGAFAGCSAAEKKDDGKISVICTIFPIYDWARNVVGGCTDKVDVKMLVDNGVDLHNFQPTAGDIAARDIRSHLSKIYPISII